jgi:hypothetical protein
LDVTDDALIVRSTPAAQAADLARLESLVAAARNGTSGRWTSDGITSSAALSTPNTTLAVIPNPGLAQFSGQPVGPHDILIAHTWNGDANLDGVVDADDYFRIDNGLLSGKRGFANGDFNYDATIDADDYFLIDNAYLSPAARTSLATAASAVVNPEPSATSMVIAISIAALRRKRRAA